MKIGLLRKARAVDPFLQQGEGLIGGMDWQFSTYALNLPPSQGNRVKEQMPNPIR